MGLCCAWNLIFDQLSCQLKRPRSRQHSARLAMKSLNWRDPSSWPGALLSAPPSLHPAWLLLLFGSCLPESERAIERQFCCISRSEERVLLGGRWDIIRRNDLFGSDFGGLLPAETPIMPLQIALLRHPRIPIWQASTLPQPKVAINGLPARVFVLRGFYWFRFSRYQRFCRVLLSLPPPHPYSPLRGLVCFSISIYDMCDSLTELNICWLRGGSKFSFFRSFFREESKFVSPIFKLFKGKVKTTQSLDIHCTRRCFPFICHLSPSSNQGRYLVLNKRSQLLWLTGFDCRFCIIEGPETVQDFAKMELQEIQDNIRSRRNKIFLHMEEATHKMANLFLSLR